MCSVKHEHKLPDLCCETGRPSQLKHTQTYESNSQLAWKQISLNACVKGISA